MGKAALFPNPFTSRVCEIFNCLNRSEWFVGDPTGPHSVTFMLCDSCVRNLLHTAPSHLLEGGADLLTKVRAEFDTEKEKLFAEEIQRRAHAVLVKEQEEFLKTQKRLEEARAKLAAGAYPAMPTGTKDEPLPFDELAEEEDSKKPIYRCLECDDEFESKRALTTHMKTHKGE